jgi:hypothetical protein
MVLASIARGGSSCTRTDPEQGNRIDPESVGRLSNRENHSGSASKQSTQLGFLLRQADMFPPNLREFLRAGGSSQIILILLGVVLLAKAIMSIRR